MDLGDKLSLYSSTSQEKKASAKKQPLHGPGTGREFDNEEVAFRVGDSSTGMEIVFQRLEGDLYFRRVFYEDLEFGNRRLAESLRGLVCNIDELVGRSNAREGGLIHREEVLFLDTETTGLQRGPGNFPFLFGLAYFRGDSMVFEQYFLDGPGGEEAFQSVLRQIVSRFAAICTYNGKSFDIPVIKNRFILLGDRFRAPAIHLDLYHFWKSLRGGSRRRGFKQKDLEEELLGFVRIDDLPGSEVPQTYFDYRKYGKKDGLGRVFQHNEWDLQGLTMLFLEASRALESEKDQSAVVRSGIARMFVRRGKVAQGKTILEELSALNNYDSDLLYSDRLLLAFLLKREHLYEESYQRFLVLARDYGCIQSHIEASRHLEHRLRDIAGALALVEDAQRLVERMDGSSVSGSLPTETRRAGLRKNRWMEDLVKRKSRLVRKQEQSQKRTASK